MKKLSLNAKFITTSLFCLALLAVPALAVQGQALYYAAPQPRPQVPGVMSDEVRLDPLAGALYRLRRAGRRQHSAELRYHQGRVHGHPRASCGKPLPAVC